jgi:hypothetical protein
MIHNVDLLAVGATTISFEIAREKPIEIVLKSSDMGFNPHCDCDTACESSRFRFGTVPLLNLTCPTPCGRISRFIHPRITVRLHEFAACLLQNDIDCVELGKHGELVCGRGGSLVICLKCFR